MEDLVELRNKRLKPWSFYPFTHQAIERRLKRMEEEEYSKVKVSVRKKFLRQCTLIELFQELHRRAQDDIEEDEEVDWEDELSQLHYQKLAKQFPHVFGKREVS